MQPMISKWSIIICSLALALDLFELTPCVIALLLALSLSGMTVFFEKRTVTYFLSLSGCFAGILFPPMAVFVPVFAYDCGTMELSLREKCPVFAGTAVSWLSLYYKIPFPLFCICGCLLVLSIVTALSASKIRELSTAIRKNRDSDRELQLVLEQKNADLLEKSQYEIEAATLRERNRIAREIHDNVGHLLTRSILQVGALKTINKNEQLAPHFEQISETLNNAMDTIRASVHNLYQTELDLRTSLETYFASVPEPAIEFEYAAEHVPREMSCHLLSIIKEAVHNTTRHSNADHILIHFIEHPMFYQLTIEDNGTTSSPSDTTPGMGLTSMQERVALMHGSMEIFHEHGFKIFITVMKE